MQIGVHIKSGIQDWQIIQQGEGRGTIYLEGVYNRGHLTGDLHVHVRVVHEESGEYVVPWKEAKLLPNDRWKICITDIPAGGLVSY